ncbi:phage holin family protein [Variovorax dokdonensis]|uniref:Phage holin family protein n=1 Tax=Variovorax dokdonensis TaxID=344883 RepID=A0ABT7N7Z4_9BURK|nr:phage holin family protein [Variovorax dokdonensis]MDM0044063.1 phage holin family protein [Variovorax dokdonensis]
MSPLAKRLLALTGLDRRVQQMKIAAGEGALAAEDRAQLLRFAWEEERDRLRLLLLLVVAVAGLTTVAVALVSVAVVVNYWDTPQRTTAAWAVAIVWLVIWVLAVLGLFKVMQRKSSGVDAVQQEFARDWHWIQAQIGSRPANRALRAPRPANRAELLARMERQRERIATLQHPPPGSGAARQEQQSQDIGAQLTALAKSHPVASAAIAAAAIAVVRPRRVIRLATWLAPIVWKFRR